MSLNKLVNGDCGGNNSLVQLSNIVKSNASISKPHSQSELFVNEFIAQTSQAPQTFNMNSLLHNMPEAVSIPKISQPVQYGRTSYPSPQTSRPWMVGPPTTDMFVNEFIAQTSQAPQTFNMNSLSNNMPETDSIPKTSQPVQYVQNSYTTPQSIRAGPPTTGFMPPHMLLHNMFGPQHCTNPYSAPHFQVQYMNESEPATHGDLRAKAQEYVDNDEVAQSNFASFMKKVAAGEISPGVQQSKEEQSNFHEVFMDRIAKYYKEDWEKLSDVSDYWNSENANGIAEEYPFTEGNAMLEIKNALEMGKEKLKMGDIPGAVLCFEAAVQQQPDSAEAWFYLGTTQAENEQDPLAITALKKSLSIDPRQLEAYITLAAAYTNENMPKYAFNALLDWLKASPKYSDLFPLDVETKKFDLKELEAYVKGLYLRAAQLNPSEIDADVQNALGVVFNISQEYDKAVDCFKTALMVAYDNAKLWNRLGATLANSERSEEAVEAYHEALNLEPGFIRARYNVGITCMNLGAYKQAAEHFLVTLNQQYKAKSMFPVQSTSDTSSSTIWTTLRMVCSFMAEHDAVKLVDDRNLTQLNKHFKMGNN